MKKILLFAAALFAALPALAVSGSPETETVDTLKSAVVTGTRVAMERDRIPAPVSVVGRARIATSDESSLMPSLMEEVPGLFVTSRGVTGYGVSSGAAGGISLRGFGAGSGRTLVLIDTWPSASKSRAARPPSCTAPMRWAARSTSSPAVRISWVTASTSN